VVKCKIFASRESRYYWIGGALSPEHALAIINEGKVYNAYEGEAPEDPKELVKEAKTLVKQAHEAYKAGAKGEAVVSILKIAETTFESDKGQGVSEVEPVHGGIATAALSVPPSPGLSLEAKYEQGTIGQSKIQAEGLPIPPKVGNPPDLPFDFSKLKPQDIRIYHSEFHALSCRANYLLSVEKNYHAVAKRIADMHVRRYLSNTPAEKGETVTDRKAAAESDPDVMKWREKEFTHELEINTLKTQAEDYARTCDRLSREASMRAEEMKHD
jgi:hypothetical protein